MYDIYLFDIMDTVLCAAVWEAVAGHTQRARGNTHHRVVELDVLAVSCWLGF